LARRSSTCADRGFVFEVEFDDLSSAPGHRFQILFGADAVERDHFRAHVPSIMQAKGPGPDAGEFDDAKAPSGPEVRVEDCGADLSSTLFFPLMR